MRTPTLAATLLLALAASANALPPNAPRHLVGGANHHTGDTAFIADLGRAPRQGEEKLRMHEHFVAVRARLAAAHAPRPELEAKRRALLAALDDYIAKGLTPKNEHLPWRTPVFIDDEHTICAVGYLIERSAGRPLAEQIATSHRYSFIEDIARDMPEVRAWVAESGFTLEELGQIQPGYMGPDVLQWHPWELADDGRTPKVPADGAYDDEHARGHFAHHHMDGEWTARDDDGKLVGKGTFQRGAGTWTSFYPTGTALATGAFARDVPTGAWTFFHPSGRVAAEGRFEHGQRVGRWHFYYDTATKTPIAEGRFDDGNVAGTWKHFDAHGALLATSVVDTPEPWSRKAKNQLFWSVGYRVDVVPEHAGPTAGLIHEIHKGSLDGRAVRLDLVATPNGAERIYVHGAAIYDDRGELLVQDGRRWMARDCHWSKRLRRAAGRGDVAMLHGLLDGYGDDDDAKVGDGCDAPVALAPARAERIATLAAVTAPVTATSPELVTALALGDEDTTDLPNYLVANMSLDIEWPHVDGRFVQVYKTLPGYRHM